MTKWELTDRFDKCWLMVYPAGSKTIYTFFSCAEIELFFPQNPIRLMVDWSCFCFLGNNDNDKKTFSFGPENCYEVYF